MTFFKTFFKHNNTLTLGMHKINIELKVRKLLNN